MNSFGTRLKFTSFGESHSSAIGFVLDGLPAGLKIDEEFLENELSKRRGGTKFSTPRKEEDKAEILSGVFKGFSTGMPIGVVIFNKNIRSKDYEDIKDVFRPSHADYTYFHKFGLRDYRGGGRASARESVARVAAGAFAGMLLNEFNIKISSGVFGVGKFVSNLNFDEFDFKFALESEIFALDKTLEETFKQEILAAKNAKDSVGCSVFTRAFNVPVGLGEVLYDKLDSKLAHAIMGINAVKAVEIGQGTQASKQRASKFNDCLKDKKFLSNNNGGILGGISTSQDLLIRSYFKPTPSIFLKQETINENLENKEITLKGRHDPCVGIRGSVVVSAMTRLVLADCLLLNASSKLENLHKIYKA